MAARTPLLFTSAGPDVGVLLQTRRGSLVQDRFANVEYRRAAAAAVDPAAAA
ncbi:hypothetical protein [Streptomyces sp. 147326]|uniref:hypothetical protein n=1 Tax=Streptomyces sp. 147326 TaxID=3074379 RepID=UPI003857483B